MGEYVCLCVFHVTFIENCMVTLASLACALYLRESDESLHALL